MPETIDIWSVVIYKLKSILLLKICLSMFANCRSQFLLNRLRRCLKLFASTVCPHSHEFASQFGLVSVTIYGILKLSSNAYMIRHAKFIASGVNERSWSHHWKYIFLRTLLTKAAKMVNLILPKICLVSMQKPNL